ncbi:hypothetical protein JRQ81_014050 [Phrynocephalus forsythii]|uniref:CMP-N-acetylneuraminate-beta-galactosamide-alpha-2,3-sialyltransferase 2 n=1 Tax=Phrynocephalus forsythii TaxID=171643 RepID=A0A9Q0XXV2_9SAUR|nr:hypothetical protein JRQ81_014050 [Phrynocephalus forsythii]
MAVQQILNEDVQDVAFWANVQHNICDQTSIFSHECLSVSVGACSNLKHISMLPRQLCLHVKGVKKLQRSQDVRSQIQVIMKNLFDILPSLIDQVQDIAQCGKCAVVGNSGRLKGSKYGEKIDSHQFVLRINTAPTKGFELDVGRRTTHRFIYPESAMNLNPGTHLVLLPFKPLDLKWLASAFSSGDIKHTYKRVQQFIQADKNKVLIIHPGFLKYIHDKWTKQHGRYPSTGLTALIFAIHVCTQVSAFGFGADSNGDWHHYWEENYLAGAFRKTRVHDGDFEFVLIKRLAAEGKVSFYS